MRCDYRDGWQHCNYGDGIWEFRVGDVVENVHTGKQQCITALFPLPSDRRMGSPCVVELDGWGRCCVLVLRPVNPERIRFGFVTRTTGQYQGKNVCGSARWPTLAAAEEECKRLAEVGFPGTVEILDHDDVAAPSECKPHWIPESA
jgi:hypothetical protein